MSLLDKFFYELDIRGRIQWCVHNGIAHPLMVVLPRSVGEWFHDVTIPTRSEERSTTRWFVEDA